MSETYYIRVVNFLKNYRDVRPMQFTKFYRLVPLNTGYADVLEHISLSVYIKYSFFRLAFLSHALHAHRLS